MARHRTESALSVSLFPFLAVLVCAMGALILLLLIITKQVKQQAAQKAISKTELPLIASSDTEKETVPSNVFISRIEPAQSTAASNVAPTKVAYRDPILKTESQAIPFETGEGKRQKQRLAMTLQAFEKNQKVKADLVLQLAATRKQIDEEKDKISGLYQRLQTLKRNNVQQEQQLASLANDSENSKKKVKQLQTSFSKKKNELTEQRKISQDLLGKLQIVTYDGTTGIKQSPVFLECSQGKVTFQPEKVSVDGSKIETVSALEHPIGPAIHALNDYRNTQKGTQKPPYVLLLVRPDGIKEFYMIRKVLQAQKISIGYELVEQNQEFYFSPPDATSKQIIQEALSRKTLKRTTPKYVYFPKGNQGSHRKPAPQKSLNRQPSGKGGFAENSRITPKQIPFPPPMTTEKPPEGSWNKPGFGTKRFPNGQMTRDSLTKHPFPSSELTRKGTKHSPFQKRGEWKPENKHIKPEENSFSSKQSNKGKATPFAQNKEQPSRLIDQFLSTGQRGTSQSYSHVESLNERKKQLQRGMQDHLIGFEKEVKITVSASSMQVGKEPAISFNELALSKEIQQLFLKSLNDEMSKWPAPPRGFRWIPTFRISVSPGGNQYVFSLENLLKELKLKSVTHFSLGNKR